MLTVVMLGTIGKPRLLRRRWLCLPIGVFAGIILSGVFTNQDLFWWPFLGTSFPHDALLPVWWVVLIEELVGLFVCWVLVGQYDLWLPGPREEFLRTGRLTVGVESSRSGDRVGSAYSARPRSACGPSERAPARGGCAHRRRR